MTWFKNKLKKTMENMLPGLPVILKKFQIYVYPHPKIRSQVVIAMQICWI